MPPDAFLVDHDLVTAFEVGWSVLYQDVSLFVADQLVSTLADLHGVDADTRRGLRALRRELEKQREAGTPWLARDAADVLAMLDMTAWIERARIAGRMSDPARGADSRARTPHDVGQSDRVRVHLDDRPDWRHLPLHEAAPRRAVALSALDIFTNGLRQVLLVSSRHFQGFVGHIRSRRKRDEKGDWVVVISIAHNLKVVTRAHSAFDMGSGGGHERPEARPSTRAEYPTRYLGG